MEYPQFDELYVISDLHMGGEPGFQILRETERLKQFILWVSRQRPDGRVALVLNGDVIDTLAEQSVSGYIAVENAVSVVNRIMKEDDAFKGIWQALKSFVREKAHTLVLILGNHDIELALPGVQRAIIDFLCDGEAEIGSRIEFSTIGAGYTCQVGASRVFCTHGNEVDPWNYVRYEDLSKLARRLNAGRGLGSSEWEPNAGTKMVKDVMNEVKKNYKWIDLLKPETNAAVGVLLALDPAQVKKISLLFPIIGEKFRGDREADQRLSAEGYHLKTTESAQAYSVDQLLGANIREGLQGSLSAGQTADELLLSAEQSFKNRQIGNAIAETGTLGTGQLVWDKLTGWITGVGEAEALRRALKDWLASDKTFAIDDRDDTFKAVTASIGTGIDYVITGHTHLARAIPMSGSRHYFNCGTWIRLLRFTEDMLKDDASFAEIYRVLKDGSMEAIDNRADFLLDQTSAVCITREANGKTIGRLAHVKGGTDDAPITLDYV